MVDSISMDRLSLSSSNHNHEHAQMNHQFSYHRPHSANYSNSGLNDSSHGNRNYGGFNGSSHHAKGAPLRNKSFTKPRISASNSLYDPLSSNSNHSNRSSGSFLHSYKKPDLPQKGQYLAMDCEMVGTFSGESVAARVVLIDWRGRVVLDTYMKPEEEVADYRTFVSGITEENLKDAPSFADVVNQVKELLKDKILVGHGVDNDLRALGIVHPWLMTRDTAYYQPFMRLLDTSSHHKSDISTDATEEPVYGPRKLKDLTKEKLQREIQVAGVSHCPVEDAAAALDLYKSHRPRWEACMSSEERQQQQYALQMAAAGAAYESSMMTPDYSTKGSLSFTSVLTPPSRTRSRPPSRDLSMSMHSYFRYPGTHHGSFDDGFDDSNHGPVDIPLMLNTGLSSSFQQQGILDRCSNHSRMDSSLDSSSFHGSGSYPNRKNFHRSYSLSEAPIIHHVPNQSSSLQRNSTFIPNTQRQSSLKYAPPGLQHQRSLDYALPRAPNQSSFEYHPEIQEHIPFVETRLLHCSPPPGLDGC